MSPTPSSPGLRIGYLANFSPRKLGTGETRLMALAGRLAERGHDLTVFGHDPVHPEVGARLEQAGARWARLNDLKARPWASARRLGREFDVLQLNNIAPRARVALIAYGAWPAKVLFVDHVSGPPGSAGAPPRPLPHRVLDRLTMTRVWQAAGVSRFIRRRLAERFGLPDHRTLTVYGGVDVDRFRPTDRGGEAAELVVTTVAALIPDKGVDVLIDALAALRDRSWRLQVVGEGPSRPELEAQTERLRIGRRTEFLGLRDDVDRILRGTDICVHPAVWEEALGYTVLEGMASALPVVASRVGGIPELIRDGEEGILVPPGDTDALANALVRLMDDGALRARLGRGARGRVARDFTVERNLSRTVAWFEAAARGEWLLDEDEPPPGQPVP